MADTQTDDPLIGTFRPGEAMAPPPMDEAPPPVTPVSKAQPEDDPLVGTFHAGNAPVGDTSFRPMPNYEYSDIPKGLAAGYHSGVAAPVAEVVGQLPGHEDWEETAKTERRKGAEAQASLSPGAEQTWPVWLSEQAPPLAAMAGPGAVAGVLGAPVGVGLGLAAGAGALVMGGSGISNIKQSIEAAPDQDLQDNNPNYAIYRQTMPEAEAKAKLGQDYALSTGVPSAILGGALGAAGGVEVGGLVSKLGVDDAVRLALSGSGKFQNTVTGAGRGLVEAGLPGAGQEFITKHAEAQAGVGEEATPSELVTAGVDQGLFGAGVGAVGGMLHSGVHRKSTQTGGVATVPRTPAEQTATEAKPRATNVSAPGDTPTSPADAAPPPAPPKVDPDQAAAMNPKPPEVTPRVTEPPKSPVEQPEVVQPTPPPSETAREAPPEPDTTGKPPPPQTTAEASAAPVSVEPEQVLREPDQTLIDQHAALIDKSNPRVAMVWPPDVQPLDLPNKSRYGQGTLNDGRVIQYDRSGRSKLSKEYVKFADDNNRLNEILQLGPENKDQAVARVAAGEPGVGVVERTPDGTEAKAAAATSTTAPDTLAALEATKTPGNVVGIEHPDVTVGDRLKRVQAEMAGRKAELDAGERGEFAQPQEPVVQPERVVTPESNLTQTPFGPGRVLEAQDEASVRARDEALRQEAEQVRTVQEQLKARELAKQEAAAKAAGAKGRQHVSKETQDKVAASNTAAERIVAAHPHVGSYADANAVLARAKAMARAAGAEGIDVPKVFGEGHPWNAAMLKLREAKDLLSPIKKELGETREDKLGRFIDREHMIDTGNMDKALAARRAESAQGLGSPEGAVDVGVRKRKEGARADADEPAEATGEHIVPTEAGEEHAIAETVGAHEEGAIERPEEHAGGGVEEHEEKPTDAFTAAREERERKIASARAESEAIRKEAPAPKTAMGFKQEVRKNRSIKRQEMEEGHPSRKIMQVDENGNPQEITSVRQSTARVAIDEHYDPKQYSSAERQMNENLIDKLGHLAGDTEVHYISHDDMTKLAGPAYGFYDPHSDKIYLNNDYNKHDTALHEVFHAATAKALEKSPELKDLMERLRNDVRAHMPLMDVQSRGKVEYALSDPEEFLTGMMTNPEVQKLLKGVKISDELARDIGIPRWRKATMWNGILHIIQRALGLSPRDVSAIEGAMAITEKTMWSRDPGMAMEAGARSLGIKFQKITDDHIHAMGDDAQEAVSKPPSFWKGEFATARKTGMEDKLFNTYSKTANTDTLRIDNEHLFGRRDEKNSFRRIQEGMEKQSQLIRNMLSKRDPLMRRMADMKRADPQGLQDVVQLLSESADYKVHPDEALGMGLNDHIGTKNLNEKADPDNHEAILAHPRLSSTYETMDGTKQALFRDLRDAMMNEGSKNAEAHLKILSDALRQNFEKNDKLQVAAAKPESQRSPAELKQVERYNAVSKVLNGDKLDGDEADKFNEDPQIKMLRDARKALKQDGPHFPSGRKGDMVVNAEREIPEAPNAISVKDNEVTFDSRKDAFDYRRKVVDQSLTSTMEKVSDPVSSEQKPGQPERYVVRVQNKHSSAYETLHEANKASDALKQSGLYKEGSVTQPMVREKNENLDYGLHTGTVRAMDHAVDALTHLSKEQKDDLKEANTQAALGLMKGNRVNQGLMTRNRVRGANADPVLAAHDYFSTSARNRARAATMPDIDRAFDEMRETTRDVQDGNTWKRGVLTKEMETRALNFGKQGFTGQMPAYLQNLSTLAYLKYMAAPVHYMLDLTHPYLISIPQLGARHGFVRSHLAFQKALNDMGGRTPAMVKGLKGAWKAAWDSGHAPTDFISGIKDALKSNGATDDELRAVDQATETGALHSILMDFRPHFDKTSTLQTTMQRAQSVGQEMSSAVDAINRIATFVTGYRLEREQMGKPTTNGQRIAQHAQAIRYSKDNLTQTQGLYTQSNRASFMKDPKVRAIMQFRSVPMMIYKVMARNVYNAFKGDTPEVRWGAVRALVGTMGTTAALAGAGAGVPEPIRLAVMLTHMFGLTGSWQDLEDKARKQADASLGKFGGHLVMDGVLGAAGLSAGNRIGLNDLLVKGEPQSAKDFLFENFVGAPGGYLNDEMSGIGQTLHGDFKHGLPNLIPIRLASDVAKAFMENQEGKPAKGATPAMPSLDPFETFVKAMGGTPMREARYNKMTAMIKEDSANRKAAVQSGNIDTVNKWNLAHPYNIIRKQELLKARQAKTTETPRQRANAEEYSAYQ